VFVGMRRNELQIALRQLQREDYPGQPFPEAQASTDQAQSTANAAGQTATVAGEIAVVERGGRADGESTRFGSG
jgi:hypothetical protein